MATNPRQSLFESPLRARANSAASDIVMSDPADAGTPSTDPSSYSEDTSEVQMVEPEVASVPELTRRNASSILFRLPKELRLRIYSYCLTTKYSVLWPTDRLALDLHPKLLQTCSTIMDEAAPVLYSNMLHFTHPSDANMFLWAHNPTLGRTVTKLLFQIRDRDVRHFWSEYLGSTRPERSLLNDFPNLRTLHVQFRSGFLHSVGGNLHERFERWEGDRAFRELCLSLEGRVPDACDVRVLVCCRLVLEDARALAMTFPDDLSRVRDFGTDKRFVVRTEWRKVFRAEAAMEIEGQEQTKFFGP